MTYDSESTAEARDLKDGIPQAQDNREKLGALEVETKTAIDKTKLVVEVLIPLNIILIALQSDQRGKQRVALAPIIDKTTKSKRLEEEGIQFTTPLLIEGIAKRATNMKLHISVS